ncbi:hypothetical protein MMC30_008797 [Trapelia coarctata]|nr:hypothetical protein [Trapelia coarctata]
MRTFHADRSFQQPAGQGACAYSFILETTASSTEVTTDDGVPYSGTSSPELLSPNTQPASPQDAEGSPQSRRKQSAAELFPRTDHRDKEECWDESCFWGSEEDKRILKELGEEVVTTVTEEELEAPILKACRDPC